MINHIRIYITFMNSQTTERSHETNLFQMQVWSHWVQ
nr:MAG TPA: hypothetical protein [Caudoviricetes sp.]